MALIHNGTFGYLIKELNIGIYLRKVLSIINHALLN